MTDTDLFEKELRRALNYLYDPVTLRQSPLIGFFGLQENPNAAALLRQTLTSAIETLQAGDSAPQATRHELHYRVLYDRYVQGFTQREVADDLGISPRHLRRLQAEAVQALARYLWDHFGLVEQSLPMQLPNVHPDPAPDSAMERELAWVEDTMSGEWATVEPIIKESLNLARGLAQQQSVTLEILPFPPLSLVAMPATVLEQIVLNLITAVMRTVPGGHVSVAGQQRGADILISLHARSSGSKPLTSREGNQEEMEMAHRLAEIFQAEISIRAEADVLHAELCLASGQQVLVLAIEDNVDTLQLWERYLQNTRFQLVGVSDPEQAWEMVIEKEPAIILLDVMMPLVDGWKLLSQLRHHPATSTIPVIVCTVLPQKDIALSLGARDFIRKPMTRQALLAVLTRQSGAATLR